MQETETRESISIRIAAYSEGVEPDITVVRASSVHNATDEASRVTLAKVKEFGGLVPEEAVRELIDNLSHAAYEGAVISVIEEGNVVRVSDKGPGIEDKESAFEFGYSGATPEVRQEIRGIGAGLGIALAAAKKAGGTVFLDDNIGGGTVAVVSTTKKNFMPARFRSPQTMRSPHDTRPVLAKKGSDALSYSDNQGNRKVISPRPMHVLLAVFEGEIVGPTAVAERLGMNVSTAYRDLVKLKQLNLVLQPGETESGKYALSQHGQLVIEDVFGIKDADDYGRLKPEVSEILDLIQGDSQRWHELEVASDRLDRVWAVAKVWNSPGKTFKELLEDEG